MGSRNSSTTCLQASNSKEKRSRGLLTREIISCCRKSWRLCLVVRIAIGIIHQLELVHKILLRVVSIIISQLVFPDIDPDQEIKKLAENQTSNDNPKNNELVKKNTQESTSEQDSKPDNAI